MGHFCLSEENYVVEKLLAVAQFHVEILLEFFLGQSHQILPFYFVAVEHLFVGLEANCLQEVDHFFYRPLLYVLAGELQFCQFREVVILEDEKKI